MEGEITEVSLVKVSLKKLVLFSGFFGLIFGFLLGIISYIFMNSLISSFQIKVNGFGSFLLSFVFVPIGVSIISIFFGFFITLLVNFSLWVVRGVKVYFKEY